MTVPAPLHLMITVNAAWNLVNFRRGLIAALLADGHRVTVLAPPDEATATLSAMGCRVVPLRMDRKGLSPLRDAGLMLRFWRHMGRERPDAVLSYTIKNNIFGALAARLRGIPFVPNVTGLGTAFLSGRALQRLVETLYRTAFAGVPVVFFQNGDDRALFLDRNLLRSEQARLLPGSGIDTGRFAPAPLPGTAPEAPVFLMIARVLRDKGVEEYVQAARRIRADWPGARFRLLGPLGAENRTAIPRETVEAWQAEGAIDYLGAVPDVRPVIAAADCIVLPSYREGMPRTLLEAAAMARPVIATDVPGCRDALVDGETGFLCAVRDGDSLARACARFIALTPQERAAMGTAGRTRIERDFDERHVIAAYREVLARIAGR
ncbi:glycosyltransferase family 4 protein [Rhodovulum adriaticum]|uniref:Glycosyltransferase involved in cell wall biosynthesis n=1 Tax=Rhodovulum adriaticum TaxID=35804 RepID=A0A4R2NYA9_RHOAD|nr:glycosyltransferase family 4 protein [Rhodovulum adriaticum]MBK1634196.1 glycosyl transferase family 1 [Rhodovulum adriaticum]TCP27253.1 glycosyltransferase involved in cell wall biosynthesis [Rhodovulum adriaticum]